MVGTLFLLPTARLQRCESWVGGGSCGRSEEGTGADRIEVAVGGRMLC
jgi:hypothetical protein